MVSDRVGYTLSCIKIDEQLGYENYQALSLTQALLGEVTPNMVAVSIRCVQDSVHLHFYLDHETEEEREIIEDIECELSALQFTNVPISSTVSVVSDLFQTSESNERLVYLRRTPPPAA